MSEVKPYYQVEGTLGLDADSYVEREADTELYESLKNKNFCYVFNSRQMGKSSLEVRVRKKLQDEDNFRCAMIDLSKVGVDQVTLKMWYKTLISELKSLFVLDFNFNFWWEDQERQQLTYPVRLMEFIKTELLEKCSENILIVIDEIDTVLSLNFEINDFFALIRSCYNERANNPNYKRLTFCLLGVATPGDLIRDDNRTPFNIGKAINLTGLTLDEAEKNLGKGLEGKVENPIEILKSIIDWTQGQPFLTQKLCQLVVDEKCQNPDIKALVKERIINNWQLQDNPDHLKTIRSRITEENNDYTLLLLSLYKRILGNKNIVADNNDEQIKLRLSGLVVQRGEKLEVYNPIYQEVFNLPWVESELKKIRPYSQKFQNWKNAYEEHKQLYLLYGTDLDEVDHWKPGKRIPEEDNNYFTLSYKFWEKAQNCLPNNSGCEAIVIAMQSWTGGYKTFNDSLFDIAKNNYQSPPQEGNEEAWVKQLVHDLKNQWENSPGEAVDKLKALSDRLRKPQNKDIDPLWLMITYRLLFQQETIPVDNSLEQQELLDMKLVEKEGDKLKIINRLYREIFDEEWIRRELGLHRPADYVDRFISWLDFDSNDNLLSREVLQEALEPVYSKNELKLDEHLFLTKSLVRILGVQMFDRRMTDTIAEFRDNLINKSISPYPFIQSVLEWTRNHPILTPLLCKFILESLPNITNLQPDHQQAKETVDQFITNKVINQSSSPDITEHLNSVFDEIFQANPGCGKFGLLLQYRKIIRERVGNDQGLENKILCDYPLVIADSNNILEPFNRIYRECFNEDYLLDKLSPLRPYSREFIAWLDFDDESNLLSIEKYQACIKFIYEEYEQLGVQENEYITRSLMTNITRL